MTCRAAGLLAAALLVAATARAEDGSAARLRRADPAELSYTYGVGDFAPEYEPPAPGSYVLPPIDTIGDHPVVDTDGRRTSLAALRGERVAVVAFVYTTCVEAAGCPVSLAALHRLDRALAAEPELARQVRLITVSFDPERDTPARMALVRRVHRPETDWAFVTTRSDTELAPLLADFDQPVAKLRFTDGRWTGLFRHVLKVFLVDRRGRVRNVYRVGFLNPALILNDVRTVLLDAPASTDAAKVRRARR